jgi:hypothetical protein
MNKSERTRQRYRAKWKGQTTLAAFQLRGRPPSELHPLLEIKPQTWTTLVQTLHFPGDQNRYTIFHLNRPKFWQAKNIVGKVPEECV